MGSMQTMERNFDEARNLTAHQELALLLRALQREGYDDAFLGHITVKHGEARYLTNPMEVAWDQVRASDLLLVDDKGNKLEGAGTPHEGLSLHFPIHQQQSVHGSVKIVIHNHPTYATLWATRGEIPPCYEQGGAFDFTPVHLVRDFIPNAELGRLHGKAIADAGCAILGKHGVAVAGATFHEVYFRARILEMRARNAWKMQAFPDVQPMTPELATRISKGISMEYREFAWDFAKRYQLNIDKSVLA